MVTLTLTEEELVAIRIMAGACCSTGNINTSIQFYTREILRKVETIMSESNIIITPKKCMDSYNNCIQFNESSIEIIHGITRNETNDESMDFGSLD